MMNLRNYLILRAGAALLPDFKERADSFGGRKADQLTFFNDILAAARAAAPELDKACLDAGLGRNGCSSLGDIKKVPPMDRRAITDKANKAAAGALTRLESGGTGRSGRLETALDMKGVIARYADLLAILKGTGWRMGERVAALHPVEYAFSRNFSSLTRAGAVKKLIFEFIQQYILYRLVHNRHNILYAGNIFASPEAARLLLRRAVEDDPVLLITRPDALMAVLKAAGPGDRFRRLKAILTVGTALGATVRAKAKEKFGAEVFDMYASTELGYAGITCPLSDGRFHINTSSYLLEGAQDGSIIATDFNNRLMPVLRYDTGDFGCIEPGPCPCGRPGPLLKITGRRAASLSSAAGAPLHERDIIDTVFPQSLPFFQLAEDGGTLKLLLPAMEAPAAAELSVKIQALLSLDSPPVPEAAGLRMPPSGKFCYLP